MLQVSAIIRAMSSCSGDAVILCGDFNSSPDTEVGK